MSLRANSSDCESGGAKKDGSDEEEDESEELDDQQLQIMISNFAEFETTNRGKTWLGNNTEAILKKRCIILIKDQLCWKSTVRRQMLTYSGSAFVTHFGSYIW